LLEIDKKLAFPFLSSNKGTGHFFRRLNFSKSAVKLGIAANSRFKMSELKRNFAFFVENSREWV
jgi:hypothetical protein